MRFIVGANSLKTDFDYKVTICFAARCRILLIQEANYLKESTQELCALISKLANLSVYSLLLQALAISRKLWADSPTASGFIHSPSVGLFTHPLWVYSPTLSGSIHKPFVCLFTQPLWVYSPTLCGSIHPPPVGLFTHPRWVYSPTLCGSIHPPSVGLSPTLAGSIHPPSPLWVYSTHPLWVYSPTLGASIRVSE